MNPVTVMEGDGPVILAQPHSSAWLEPALAATLNERGLACADTDWHVERLYAGLLSDATTVRAEFSRYVIDANRPPDNEDLYPGQNTTSLCPTIDFTGAPIYRAGAEPDSAELARRRSRYHAPYHAALAAQIARLQSRHAAVLVFDCHSIADELPFLFDGALPQLNVGTHDGHSCAPRLQAVIARHCTNAPFSHVINGRFRGGYTTRHYGQPGMGVHAIQMELARSAYLNGGEPPPWDVARAAPLRQFLGALLPDLAKHVVGA